MEWKKEIGTDLALPIYSWCKNVEEDTLVQAKNLANHPMLFHHVALMPDAHFGYSMPIGGVIAVKDAIIPSAVGVDIGCGMRFVKTNIKSSSIGMKKLDEIRQQIERDIPMGFHHHEHPQMWDGFDEAPVDIAIIRQEIDSARKQLGTLGSGNHFIEIQKDNNDNLCIMLHSGSRNFGYKICNTFQDFALEYNKVDLPDKGLAFLSVFDFRGQEYITAMKYALQFARENRNRMMLVIKQILHDKFNNIKFSDDLDIHHNYASLEQHFGENVWIHRKGAIRVGMGDLGVIPGSMGTASYIVRGIGNADSFNSASHGAGRNMGRNDASRNIDPSDAIKAMEGISFKGYSGHSRGSLKGKLDLSESPLAYKDIEEVIKAEEDLVEVVDRLMPIAAMKG